MFVAQAGPVQKPGAFAAEDALNGQPAVEPAAWSKLTVFATPRTITRDTRRFGLECDVAATSSQVRDVAAASSQSSVAPVLARGGFRSRPRVPEPAMPVPAEPSIALRRLEPRAGGKGERRQSSPPLLLENGGLGRTAHKRPANVIPTSSTAYPEPFNGRRRHICVTSETVVGP